MTPLPVAEIVKYESLWAKNRVLISWFEGSKEPHKLKLGIFEYSHQLCVWKIMSSVRIGPDGEIIHVSAPPRRRQQWGSIHSPPQTPAQSVFQNSSGGSEQGKKGSGFPVFKSSAETPSSSRPAEGLSSLHRPFDAISVALGIDDKIVNIPGVPAIGLTPTEVKLVYVLAVVFLWIIFQERGLMFALLFFALYKHSNP